MSNDILRATPGPTLVPSPGRPDPRAVYGRFSNAELQRASSINQQVNACKDAVAKDGGYVPDHDIFEDPGVLGSEENRPGLNRLMDLVRTGRNDFSHLYIFDTSRLARDGEFAAKLRKFFKHHGITLHFVSNGMVSDNQAFEMQHAIFSAIDAQFSVTLGANVKRGHREQFLAGMVPCGRAYGFRNVEVIDPAFVESFDHKLKRKGVIHQIDEEQAEVLLLMKDLRLKEGLGYQAIARHLNERGIRSPRKPSKNPTRGWSHGTVRNMLINPRYIGLIRHGAMETLKDPETKKIVHRKRPDDQVITYRNESLRIFSDQEHHSLVERADARKDIYASRQAGGFGRTKQSRSYLLSGLLKCASCGSNISICQGGAYMCTNAWKGMGCRNKMKLNRAGLEQHLMEVLAATVRASATFDWLKERVLAEIQKQETEGRAAASKASSRKNSAESDLARLNHELDTLALAMRKHGFSETLSNALRAAEQEKDRVMEILDQKVEPRLEMSEEEVIDSIGDALRRLDEILLSDPIHTREELRKRIDGLSLEPITFENAPAYKVRGDVRLFGGSEPVMLSSTSSTSTEHHFLTLGLDGLILKLDERGAILRAVRPPKRPPYRSEEPMLLAA